MGDNTLTIEQMLAQMANTGAVSGTITGSIPNDMFGIYPTMPLIKPSYETEVDFYD